MLTRQCAGLSGLSHRGEGERGISALPARTSTYLAQGRTIGDDHLMAGNTGCWSVVCRAKAKSTGQRCRRFAIHGGFVCIKHGGSAPQVRRAADRRYQAFLVEQGLARQAPRDISALLTGLGKVARNRLAQLRMEGY
jgi:hypothetical protein